MANRDQNHAPCPRPSKSDLRYQAFGQVVFRILCIAAGIYIAHILLSH
jgi:hypothetical protein